MSKQPARLYPESEQAGDRIEQLTEDQKIRLLFRLAYRAPGEVNAAIDSFEPGGWEQRACRGRHDGG